jgi:hypothetical protein
MERSGSMQRGGGDGYYGGNVLSRIQPGPDHNGGGRRPDGYGGGDRGGGGGYGGGYALRGASCGSTQRMDERAWRACSYVGCVSHHCGRRTRIDGTAFSCRGRCTDAKRPRYEDRPYPNQADAHFAQHPLDGTRGGGGAWNSLLPSLASEVRIHSRVEVNWQLKWSSNSITEFPLSMCRRRRWWV